MKPTQILLRCYAERKEGYWQAFCIDLNLAVQGDSFEEVKQKLHEQMHDYLRDILEGEDRPYAAQLLTRKAPLSLRAKYHLIRVGNDLRGFIAKLAHRAGHSSPSVRYFQDTMPLKLAC